MAGLETLHRRVDIGVEGWTMPALADRSPEIIRRLRSTATSWIDDAELELLGRRHDRPAALRDDAAILPDRLLDIERRSAALKIGRCEATLPPLGWRGRRTGRPNCRGAAT